MSAQNPAICLGAPRHARRNRVVHARGPLLRLLLLSFLVASTSACFVSRRVHPRSAEELRRGYGHVAGGDMERAEVAFAHALEFDPDLVEGENGLGVVARSRGDLTGALRRFDVALASDDAFAEGHANLGRRCSRRRLGDAERALRSALALNPDLIEARHNLAGRSSGAGWPSPDRREAPGAPRGDAYLHVLETDERRAAAHADLALLELLSARPGARRPAGRARPSWRPRIRRRPRPLRRPRGAGALRRGAPRVRALPAARRGERRVRAGPGGGAGVRALTK